MDLRQEMYDFNYSNLEMQDMLLRLDNLQSKYNEYVYTKNFSDFKEYQSKQNTIGLCLAETLTQTSFCDSMDLLSNKSVIDGEQLSSFDKGVVAFSAIPFVGAVGDLAKFGKNLNKAKTAVKITNSFKVGKWLPHFKNTCQSLAIKILLSTCRVLIS